LHLIDSNVDEHLKYETYVPGRPNSHVAAGGCHSCRPDKPMTPIEQRECERIFADEGLGRGEEAWDDTVAFDHCMDSGYAIFGTLFFDYEPFDPPRSVRRVHNRCSLMLGRDEMMLMCPSLRCHALDRRTSIMVERGASTSSLGEFVIGTG